MDDLIKYGKVRRAVLGVSIAERRRRPTRRRPGLPQIRGAKVQRFIRTTDSPAQKAGIEIGDIIVAASGQPVDSVPSCSASSAASSPATWSTST